MVWPGTIRFTALLVPAVGHFVGGRLGAIIAWLRFPVAGVLMMLLFAILYWLLPNARPKFHVISVGSAVAVLAWLAASFGFTE